MELVSLTAEHDIAGFDCGKASLNDFLVNDALSDAAQGRSQTYVLIDNAGQIVGYHSIATGSIKAKRIPLSSPYSELGIVLLARLAVKTAEKGKGYGKYLFFDSLRKAVEVADIAGAIGVRIDALDEEAKDFYVKYGFQSLTDRPLVLFRSMAEIKPLVH